MPDEQLKYKIGITLIDGIGDRSAKKLIAYCGGVEALFKEKLSVLKKIKVPGVKASLVDAIKNQQVLDRAEGEIAFITKHSIKPLFYLDKDYPNRLKYCDDGPVMLYSKGVTDFNVQKVISIVGTRSATSYGKKMCEKLVESLTEHEVLIVSGLAYGIDICAHKAALKNGLDTVGVLAHGLDRLYPPPHRNIAKRMIEQGALVTDYMTGTNPDRENFPMRNRIIAGLADAVIVIESGKKGGSLITAEIANSYNRDVFAVPGKVGDKYSEGCNFLIKTSRAAVIESAKDLEYILGWEQKKAKHVQKKIFVELTPEEKKLVQVLKEKGQISIDRLCLESQLSTSKAATLLLNLEFSGIVKTLPGKVYELN